MAVVASYVLLGHDHINYTYEVLSWQSFSLPLVSRDLGASLFDPFSLWAMSDSVSAISKGGKGPSEQQALLRTALE